RSARRRRKLQCSGIYAIAQTARWGAVGKHVAKVSVAKRAFHLAAQHADAEVVYLAGILRRNRSRKAGPAGTGFELALGIEKSRSAVRTAKDSCTMLVEKLSGAGNLGSSQSRDGELRRGQGFSPFVKRPAPPLQPHLATSLAVLVELHDLDRSIQILKLVLPQ